MKCSSGLAIHHYDVYSLLQTSSRIGVFENAGCIIIQEWWGQQIRRQLVEKTVCYSHRSQEKGPHCAMEGHMGKHQGGSVRGQNGQEMWVRAFTVASTVPQQDSISRLSRLVWIILAASGAQGLSLVVWYLALGWYRQGEMACSVWAP